MNKTREEPLLPPLFLQPVETVCKFLKYSGTTYMDEELSFMHNRQLEVVFNSGNFWKMRSEDSIAA